MLIVDMPMPVKEWNCLDCKAICADLMRGHYCGITKKTIDTLKNMRARPDWCPIKGVLPEAHGDLIDRDALGLSVQSSSIAEHGRIMHERIIGENRIAMDVLNAPAIIAAERSKR